jgi:hypothetical protein
MKTHKNSNLCKKKIMKSQSKKVYFEVFSCPGTLKIYLTTKQLASAFPNKKEQW